MNQDAKMELRLRDSPSLYVWSVYDSQGASDYIDPYTKNNKTRVAQESFFFPERARAHISLREKQNDHYKP